MNPGRINRGQFLCALRPFLLLLLLTVPATPAIAVVFPPPDTQEAPRGRHVPRERRPGDFPPPDDVFPPPSGDGEPGPPRFRKHRPMRHAVDLFRPDPRDFGPLVEGEEAKLLAFAENQLPIVAGLIRNARQNGPPMFERRFRRELVPMLRKLQRVFEESPEIGELHRRHAEAIFQLQRIRRTLLDEARPETRQRSMDEARRLIREMIGIEAQVLASYLARLEQNRDVRTQERYSELIAPDADLAGEPPVLRDAVRAMESAESENDRSDAELRLRDLLNSETEREITELRRQQTWLSENAAAEVDKRVERLIMERRGPPRRP